MSDDQRSTGNRLPPIVCDCGWFYTAAKPNEDPGLPRRTCLCCDREVDTMMPGRRGGVPTLATPQPLLAPAWLLARARRPSEALERPGIRDEIRQILEAHWLRNPRIFGSGVRGDCRSKRALR